MDNKSLIENLTLALIYLTAWKENQGTEFEALRSWKSYDWDATDTLIDQDFIYGNRRNKSVYLTSAGVKEAQHVIDKLRAILADEV